MTEITNALTLLGMLERGDAAAALNTELAKAVTTLNDMSLARPKVELKGKLTLTVDLVVEDGSIEITCGIKTKLPEEPRSKSFFFLTADGKISTEHPRQRDMFPRDATKPRATDTQ